MIVLNLIKIRTSTKEQRMRGVCFLFGSLGGGVAGGGGDKAPFLTSLLALSY